ncbi:GspH/FimT family pseudopilin [Legionella waltersii]|uniref:Tfp type 4 fimbrial pilin like signal peptide protein domain protein n=1 Tax=Legionella waltersii TaxID=66969 RepID=A0A0W1ALY4_9GAMM|nr:prepilin-type N-terminal cleavage/methylation domain-containing protein [Legionella waltersii]KTD82272.1 Tfp type 4 fimbrial pilin like signal peptide protein domain protein [Legionella waltersii]SNV04352.1 Tfp type 4 fimbrial pilin like signal peptide protein domain protein [Legionella waltersii]
MGCKGLSLLELVVALAIISVLLVLVVPAYRNTLDNNEQQVLIDTIYNAVQYSKHQAIQLGYPLYLLPIRAKKGWSDGLLLSKDKKQNSMSILNEWTFLHRNWSLKWKGVDSNTCITISNSPMHAMSNGTFVLENQITHEKVVLLLNRLGRLKRA